MRYLMALLTVLLATTFVFTQAPTIPASNLSFSSLEEGDRINFSFTNGNGFRRIVVVRQGSAVTGSPVDGVDYNHNNTFGNGDTLADNEYVVFDGTGNSGIVLNLQPNTVYHFAVFEYNGTGGATAYLTANPAVADRMTATTPTVQASSLSSSNITGSEATLSWVNGNGLRRIAIMREANPVNVNPSNLTTYFANNNFGTGTQIGSGNYVVSQNTSSSIVVRNLKANTTYHVSVFEFNGSSGPVYLVPGVTHSFTTGTVPTITASNLMINSADGNRLTLNFTKGNGVRRIVVAKAGGPVTNTPQDNTSYSANTVFGSGDELLAGSGEYVLYNNNGASVVAQALAPSTNYHFAVFEYNSNDTEVFYQLLPPATTNGSTLSPPGASPTQLVATDIASSTVTLTWEKVSNTRTLLTLRDTSDALIEPTDLLTYFASPSFGNGQHLGSNNYVVDQTSDEIQLVSNLSPGVTYEAVAYSYNGVAGPLYRRPGHTLQFTTLSTPTVASSNFQVQQIEGDRIRSTFTPGNGAARIMVAKAGSPVAGQPQDSTIYTANTTFGLGSEIAPGEFVVFQSTGNIIPTPTTFGLNPATEYHFAVFEYNVVDGFTVYQPATLAPLREQVSTAAPPSVQASALSISDLTSSQARFHWVDGNGFGTMIVLRKASTGSISPIDASIYSFNQSFGNGNASSILGEGVQVIYKGSASNTGLITNLQAGTEYVAEAYAYNGAIASVFTRPAVSLSFITDLLPSEGANDLSFSDIGVFEMRLNWDNGNGQRRLVLAREGQPVDTMPTQNTSYTANTIFGQGTSLGPDVYVVGDTEEQSLRITGLMKDSTYHFAIFEYAANATDTAYLIPGLLGQASTVTSPTEAPINLQINNITNTSANINWTLPASADRVVVLVSDQGPPNTDPMDGDGANGSSTYGNGLLVGNAYTISNTSNTFTPLTGLLSGTTYHVATYSANGIGSSPAFFYPPARTSFVTTGPPAIPTTNLQVTDQGDGSLQLNWTNGSGQKRLVVARQSGAVVGVPQINTSYLANSFFGSGDQLQAGEFVLYAGSDNQVTVTNFMDGETYHFAVFEYNDSGSIIYQIANPARAIHSAILPVDWLGVSATWRSRNTVEIRWNTLSEVDNTYFSLQYSMDGAQFINIREIAAGNTPEQPQDYQCMHIPSFHPVHYYRVRQHDFDGTYTDSHIVTLVDGRFEDIEVYPQPAADMIVVRSEHSMSTLTIYDTHGHIKVVPAQKLSETRWQLDISTLPAGAYFLVGTSNSVNYNTRFLIVR